MPERQNFSSSFVNKPSIFVLFCLALTASYFQMASICGFLLFLDFLFFLAYFWGKASLNQVEISIQAENRRMFPGSVFLVSYQVENRKNLPLIWLDLLQAVEERECVVPDDSFQKISVLNPQTKETAYFFQRKFTWIMWGQKLVWKTNFSAQKRGIYSIDTLELSSGDGFGLSVERKKYPLASPAVFVVYPKKVMVDTSFFIRSSSFAEPDTNGYYEDLSLMKGIRRYENRDSMKKINWRMAARGGEIQVNLYEKMKPKAVSFLLDFVSFAEAEEELEKMLSVVGSAILVLSERKMKCGLIFPEMEGQQGCFLLPNQQILAEDLLMKLSEVKSPKAIGFFDEKKLISSQEWMGHVYFMTRSLETFACASLLTGFQKNNVTLIVNEWKEGAGIRFEQKVVPLSLIWKEGAT